MTYLPSCFLFFYSCVSILLLSSVARGDEQGGAPYFEVGPGKVSLESFPLKSTSTSVRIRGIFADVKVTQVYRNDGDETIEATYVFPGSTKAAVHGLEMQVGDRIVKAAIEEKQNARVVYEKAKTEGKTASLLEQHRPNVFQMNLANILPGDEVRVVLSYTEWLVSEKGVFEFVYPMVVGPRYSGEAVGDAPNWVKNPYLGEGKKGTAHHDVEVLVEAGVPLHSVQSPSHKVKVQFPDVETAVVRLAAEDGDHANRDYVLRYTLSGSTIESGLLVSKGETGNYFLAMIQPPARESIQKELKKDYIFVVDVSGSMYGFPLDTTKALMKRLFAKLDSTDTFNVLLFAGASTFLSEESLPATNTNKLAALKFLSKEHGGGGTELLPAMKRAFSSKISEGRSRSVVVVTDGYISVEPEVFKLVESSLAESNVFSFGIGTSVNRFLIEGLARVGQGEACVVLHPRESENKSDRFSEYISTPLLTGLSLSSSGVELDAVEPVSIPDLMAERPIYVFGKWNGDDSGVLNLKGRSVEGDFVCALDFSSATVLPKGDRTLELMWARNRLQRLSDYGELGMASELKQQVTNLGLTHGLLTKYTSFVAVDELVQAPVGAETKKVEQALQLPKAVSNLAVGSQSVPVTPEPSTWALFLSSVLFVAFVLVRRIFKRA